MKTLKDLELPKEIEQRIKELAEEWLMALEIIMGTEKDKFLKNTTGCEGRIITRWIYHFFNLEEEKEQITKVILLL